MKICYTGGGTLGHIYPSLAVHEQLKLKDNKLQYFWIGRKNDEERECIENANIEFLSISCGKLRRYFSLLNIIDPFKIVFGFFQSLLILKKRRVDVVFSKGGFVSVPVVYAASILKIPVVTHESDFSLGLATKLNMRVASKICLGFEKEDLKDTRFIYTGNPIRENLSKFIPLKKEKILQLIKEDKDEFAKNYNINIKDINIISEKFDLKKPIILVIGGSQGALEINKLILSNLSVLLKKYNIIHQMGKTYKKIDEDNYIGLKNIGNQLGYYYKISDLVISRSGANVLTELMAFRVNSMLIPLLHSSRGEQLNNAQYYKNKGCTEILEERENSQIFIDTIDYLLNNKEKKAFRNANMNKINIENAKEKISNLLLSFGEDSL